MRVNKYCFTMLFGSMFLMSLWLSAQSGKVPPLKFVQMNGKVFTARDLPMGKPIIIIYFSPECDHCDVMTNEMMKHPEKDKKASVAVVTYLPVDQVCKFVQKHWLAKLSNFYAGTKGNSFFLRNYYKLN